LDQSISEKVFFNLFFFLLPPLSQKEESPRRRFSLSFLRLSFHIVESILFVLHRCCTKYQLQNENNSSSFF